MPKPAEVRIDRHASAVPNAGDLAVAGAIPATFVATPAIAEGGATVTPSPSARLAAPGAGETDQAHDIIAASPLGGSGGLAAQTVALAAPPGAVGVPSPAPAAAAAPETAGHAAMIAPFVPIPHGAGAPDTVAMGQAASTPLPDLAAPAQDAPDAVSVVAAVPAGMMDIAALDAVRTSVATLQESLAALADRLPDATAGVQPALEATHAAVTQALDGVQAQVGDTIAAATATVDQAADGIAGQLSHTIAAVTVTADQTTDRVTDQIGDTIATVGAATTALTAPVLNHVAEASATAADVTAQVGDTVATVIPPVTALLDEGFAGHDPASGITTLVSMVSAADAFGLHDAATGAGEALTPALGALGAADLLADVAPIDALLGVSDHHDSHGLADLDGLLGHG